MPMGTHHRETGVLRNSERGLILQVDGGGVYALDTDIDALKLLGTRVTVEGTRPGFDRLNVHWIGPAAPG